MGNNKGKCSITRLCRGSGIRSVLKKNFDTLRTGKSAGMVKRSPTLTISTIDSLWILEEFSQNSRLFPAAADIKGVVECGGKDLGVF